jgi:hypothetical protein
LWDIDRVISLALLYTCLTAILGLVYIGSVVGLQALSVLVTRNTSNATIAVSTLLVVALFAPLRRRLQYGIDRRFYRRKYDAARTLAGLGERLADEVRVGAVCHEVMLTVHDTFRPEHVSLFLRDRSGKKATGWGRAKWPP